MTKETKRIRITKEYKPPKFKKIRWRSIRCTWCNQFGKCGNHQNNGEHVKFGGGSSVSYMNKKRRRLENEKTT